MKTFSRNNQIATALGLTIIQVSRAFGAKSPRSQPDVDSMTRVKDAKSEYTRAFRGSQRQEAVLAKWITLCMDSKELIILWATARNDLIGESKRSFIWQWLKTCKNMEDLRFLMTCFSGFTIRELEPIVHKASSLIDEEQSTKKKK